MQKPIKEGLIKGAVAWVAQHVLALLWPFLTTILTVIAGWANGIPWFYIIVGAVFVSASAITGLLRFDEWRSRHSVRDKLNFQTSFLGLDIARDETGGPIALSKAQLGIVLQNIANVPISYIVDEITTSYEGRINPKSQRLNNGGIIGAQAITFFRDDTIALENVPLKDKGEGWLSFRLRYGRHGFEKYELAKRIVVTSNIDIKAGKYLGSSWVDAPQESGKGSG